MGGGGVLFVCMSLMENCSMNKLNVNFVIKLYIYMLATETEHFCAIWYQY